MRAQLELASAIADDELVCGITGILSPSRRQVVVPMTDAITHRGPDACGYYRNEHVALRNPG